MAVTRTSDAVVVGFGEVHDALDTADGGGEEGKFGGVVDGLAPVGEGDLAVALVGLGLLFRRSRKVGCGAEKETVCLLLQDAYCSCPHI